MRSERGCSGPLDLFRGCPGEHLLLQEAGRSLSHFFFCTRMSGASACHCRHPDAAPRVGLRGRGGAMLSGSGSSCSKSRVLDHPQQPDNTEATQKALQSEVTRQKILHRATTTGGHGCHASAGMVRAER